MNKKFDFNLALKGVRFPAFTLNELLISLLIMSIVGGTVIFTLFMTMQSFRQTDDHTLISQEIEFVMNALRPQFTNIGLGMPNNSEGLGSFNISFTGPSAHPIMANMGDITRTNTDWGGPVTLGISGAHDEPANAARKITARNAAGVFAGQELFYAWGVPTDVRLSNGPEDWSINELSWSFSSENSNRPPNGIRFRFLRDAADASDNPVNRLVNFTYDSRRIGITNNPASTRSWILFPSFRIPVLIESINADNSINARVSPYSFWEDGLLVQRANSVDYEGSLSGYEEVHLLQAACLFVDGRGLVQRVYDVMPGGFTDKVLSRNVVAAFFVFDDARRTLSMHIAARGNQSMSVPPAEGRNRLRSQLPDFFAATVNSLPNAVVSYRILVGSMTWRIRN